MVRVRYSGLQDSNAWFEGLRPYRVNLVQMQALCRPFSADYMILEAAKRALDTAAFHFTGEPDFFSLNPPQS